MPVSGERKSGIPALVEMPAPALVVTSETRTSEQGSKGYMRPSGETADHDDDIRYLARADEACDILKVGQSFPVEPIKHHFSFLESRTSLSHWKLLEIIYFKESLRIDSHACVRWAGLGPGRLARAHQRNHLAHSCKFIQHFLRAIEISLRMTYYLWSIDIAVNDIKL